MILWWFAHWKSIEATGIRADGVLNLRRFLRLCLKRNDLSKKQIWIPSTTICGLVRYGQSLRCGVVPYFIFVFFWIRLGDLKVTCGFCHELEVGRLVSSQFQLFSGSIFIGDNWGVGNMLVPQLLGQPWSFGLVGVNLWAGYCDLISEGISTVFGNITPFCWRNSFLFLELVNRHASAHPSHGFPPKKNTILQCHSWSTPPHFCLWQHVKTHHFAGESPFIPCFLNGLQPYPLWFSSFLGIPWCKDIWYIIYIYT